MPFSGTSAWFQKLPFFSTIPRDLKSIVARFCEEDLLAFERKEPREEACPLSIHPKYTALSLGKLVALRRIAFHGEMLYNFTPKLRVNKGKFDYQKHGSKGGCPV